MGDVIQDIGRGHRCMNLDGTMHLEHHNMLWRLRVASGQCSSVQCSAPLPAKGRDAARMNLWVLDFYDRERLPSRFKELCGGDACEP